MFYKSDDIYKGFLIGRLANDNVSYKRRSGLADIAQLSGFVMIPVGMILAAVIKGVGWNVLVGAGIGLVIECALMKMSSLLQRSAMKAVVPQYAGMEQLMMRSDGDHVVISWTPNGDVSKRANYEIKADDIEFVSLNETSAEITITGPGSISYTEAGEERTPVSEFKFMLAVANTRDAIRDLLEMKQKAIMK